MPAPATMIDSSRPRAAPRSRRTGARIGRAVVAAIGLGGALLVSTSLRDPTPRFLERRSHLVA
ncbi:MAG TPA: hypothetical protein VHQ45_06915, partial [Gemmatimonadaceae bacterium]|nr:hypothetical protein [Gemmatimonadaceae bacterium]